MIKIIGESQDVLKQAVCRGCAAILEYTKSEVKERHGKDYSGGADGQEWIDCPRCHSQVVLRSW